MTKRGMLIASAAASLIIAGAVTARAAEPDKGGGKVMCEGVNACKGQGACATAENTCGGKNECKGHGVVATTPEDCKAKGGKVQGEKK